jgi:hypothetical protein
LLSPIDTSALTDRGYQVDFHFHAAAILFIDFPEAWDEICCSLLSFDIPMSELIGSSGGEAKGTQRLRRSLNQLGWVKTNFTIEKTINGVKRESVSHEVDHVKSFGEAGLVALEIEWNNKDPSFDRDLENYKRLHAEGAIDVGIIITRGSSLQAGLPNMVTRYLVENSIDSFDDLIEHGYIPTRKCHEAIAARDAHAVIPPRKNAKPWRPTSAGAIARNDEVNAQRYLGRTLWRRWSG